METVDIIFTSRSLGWKPISWVNAIARIVTKSPFDHVSLEYRDNVFESTAGGGVQKIHWSEWVKGRENTYLMVYQVPRERVSFNRFEELKGKKYDYPANLWHLIGADKMLKKKRNKRIYCSELIADMLGYPNSYEITPDMLERELREYNCYITEI
jgi:hypothetical protein